MDFMPKPKRSAAFPTTAAEDEDFGGPVRPQDPLVASVMEEDQARKRAKKGGDVLPGKTKRDNIWQHLHERTA